jgi:methylated-DNA-[protein]-cysteine S-methyltransferase
MRAERRTGPTPPGSPPDLTAAFAAARLIDVAYTVEDSPLGPLLLAGTDRGLLRLAYPNVAADVALAEIAARISPRIIAAPRRLDATRRQLEAYFDGRLQSFDLPLDRRLIRPGFFGQVLAATGRIPYGETISYAGVAAVAGRPRAFRAAGSALGANPLPVIIPCHRVLATGGGLGGYAGGVAAKLVLLKLEGSYSAT